MCLTAQRGLPRWWGRKKAGAQGSSHRAGDKRSLNLLFFCPGSLLLGASTLCAAEGNFAPSVSALPDSLQLSQLAGGFHHDRQEPGRSSEGRRRWGQEGGYFVSHGVTVPQGLSELLAAGASAELG